MLHADSRPWEARLATEREGAVFQQAWPVDRAKASRPGPHRGLPEASTRAAQDTEINDVFRDPLQSPDTNSASQATQSTPSTQSTSTYSFFAPVALHADDASADALEGLRDLSERVGRYRLRQATNRATDRSKVASTSAGK